MSKYEVIITQKAKNIIKEIIQYISIQLHNEFAAQNLADLFKEKILSLNLFPKSLIKFAIKSIYFLEICKKHANMLKII